MGARQRLWAPSPAGGEGGGPGADFSFASSDFKTLGAFFWSLSEPQLETDPSPLARAARRGLAAVHATPAASRDALIRELRAELEQFSSTFSRIGSYRPGSRCVCCGRNLLRPSGDSLAKAKFRLRTDKFRLRNDFASPDTLASH